MAESFTPRFGLIQWGARTDAPSRAEFNMLTTQYETLSAIDKQDVLASRPAAGVRGTYFWDTTNGALSRDDGSSWSGVGGRGMDASYISSAVGNRPITLNAPSGQTANLLTANVNAVPVAEITAAGSFVSAGSYTGKSLSMVNATAANVVLDSKGAASQSADLLRLRNSSDANMFRVGSTGIVSGQSFQIANGTAVLGAVSSSNVTGSLFSGSAALEVVGVTGGASNTFKDMLLLQHVAADGTAVTRRLGVHIMADVSDEAKSASLYAFSSSANFANPALVLARGGTAAMLFPTAANASLGTGIGLTVPTSNDATLAQTVPSLMIGAANSSNLIMSNNKVVARNNGTSSALNLNPQGGDVTMGAGLNVTGTIAGGGTFQKIAEIVLSTPQDSVTFSSIPQTYKHLMVTGIAHSDQSISFSFGNFQFNGDTGGNYDVVSLWGSGATSGTPPYMGAFQFMADTAIYVFDVPGAIASGVLPGSFVAEIPWYSSTTYQKTVNAKTFSWFGSPADEPGNYIYIWADDAHRAGRWRNTAAITSIKITAQIFVTDPVTKFVAGSAFALYGMP